VVDVLVKKVNGGSIVVVIDVLCSDSVVGTLAAKMVGIIRR
jgi:hypothetical protein